MADTAGPASRDVIVLAGGRGRRFGADKVVHPRAGRRQVDVVVDAVRPMGGRILVAAGTRPLAVPDTIEVPDDPDHAGPLAGILGGLEAATTAQVAIVAADLVEPSVALLQALADRVGREDLPGLMPLVQGRPQPLHAVIRGDLRDALERAAARHPGAGLITVLRGVGVACVPQRRWREWVPRAVPERDIDTRADLRHLE